MRGRKPLPTRLHVLAGNPGKRHLPVNEPTAPVSDLAAPAHLAGVALETWNRLAPILVNMKVLTVADRDALEAYCVAYQTYRQAVEVVERLGFKPKSPKDRAAVQTFLRVARFAREEMRSWAAELGMTPSSRVRLGGIQPGAGSSAEDDAFFNSAPLPEAKPKGDRPGARLQ